MSATPSSVFISSVSYSKISTPRARNSATSARMSVTCQTACVCSSDVPVVLADSDTRVLPPQRKVTVLSFSLSTSRPNLVA